MKPPKNLNEMEKYFVDVIYDRRKLVKTKGYGFLEVRVYFNRNDRKYIKVGKYGPDEWEDVAKSRETKSIVSKCESILTAMEVLEEEINTENFNFHLEGEVKSKKSSTQNNEEVNVPTDNSNKSFIRYMEFALADEELRPGTHKNKVVVIDAVKRFGGLNTYGDLTPAKIRQFDDWLHDGTRSDVTISGYHKKVHKWVRQLVETDEIPHDPYSRVTIKRGKSKERRPLTEADLKRMREYRFTGKLERVRDLFIFSAYTGLSYADTQIFDFESMTISNGGMYYVDGSRVKTGTRFFTPILSPAMEVLKKYNFNLPKISNQKANDYLHLIEAQLGFRNSLTFHVARHTFATLALSHDVPIENVARMLGHEDIKTTQIYAKVLRSTIERHSEALQGALL